jgi:hypothetical protein
LLNRFLLIPASGVEVIQPEEPRVMPPTQFGTHCVPI